MPKQTTKPIDYPQAVLQQIEQLAQNIVVARKRRKETQAQWAKRLGVSQPTMARIERGDPSVAMASYVMCMWLIQPDCSLADLIAPQHDAIALEREIANVRPRRTPVESNPARDQKARQTDKPKENLTGISVAEKTAGHDLSAQVYKIQDQVTETTALAEAAKRLGYGSVAELAQAANSASSAAQIAKMQSQLAGTTALAEAAKRLGHGSVAELAQAANSASSVAQIAKMQSQLAGTTALAEAAKRLGYGSAENLVRSTNSHSAQNAAGLAALIAKAQGGKP